MIDYELVPDLMDEIKLMARRGLSQNCITQLYIIMEQADIDPEMYELGDLDLKVTRWLWRCVDAFEGQVQYGRRLIKAEECREAIRINLGFDISRSGGMSSKDRCEATLRYLRLPYTYSTWRKY